MAVWDVAAKKELHREKERDRQEALGLSRDGAIAMVVEVSPEELFPQATLLLIRPATGQYIRSIPQGQFENFYTAAFSPDNKIVAVAWAEQSPLNHYGPQHCRIRLFEVATGTELPALNTEDLAVAFQFSPAGDGLVTIPQSDHVPLRLWDWSASRERGGREGHLDSGRAVAYAPDGRTVATASDDGTILVWDVTALPPIRHRTLPALSASEFDALWADLAVREAGPAYRAIDRLARGADQTVALLRERMPSAAAVDSARIATLIAALDHDDFAERQRARMELEKLGERIEPALHKALAERPSAELRSQAEELLAKMAIDAASPERLRAIRVTALLERIDTAEARALLTQWSKGAPEARLTQEAKASLQRLTRRVAAKP
jgi:hypothetical protein